MRRNEIFATISNLGILKNATSYEIGNDALGKMRYWDNLLVIKIFRKGNNATN